jgi:hypothetical protein
MNSQDIQNLHEAYIGVYADLDEERAPGVKPYEPRNRRPLDPEKAPSGEKGDGSGYGADKKFTQDTDAKSFKPGVDVPKVKKYDRISRFIPHGIGANATKERSANSRTRGLDPNAPRSQKIAKEEIDLYDVILSHLIDEGYADTQEAAEAIMVNMSEDWRESIFEEKKPLPVSRMAKQARRIAFSHGTEVNSDEGSSGNVPHSNPEKALTKMARIGGKKVKQHIKKGYEQGSQYDPYYQELNRRNPSRNAGY